MVSPVYTAPEVLDEGLSLQEARTDGLIKRGRLVRFDELTGLAEVKIYERRGQIVTVSDVLALGSPDDIMGWRNFDVLVLSPSGRITDGAYILGPAFGPGLLYDGLRVLPTLAIAAADSVGANTPGWSGIWSPREPAGALRISRIEVGVDTIVGAVPRIEITGGGVTAFYVADENEIPPDALVDHANWEARIPTTMICRPESEPFILDEVRSFTVTARAHRFSGLVASWRGFTSTRPVPATRVDPLLAVASPRPAIRLYGRIARRLD